MTKNIKMVLEYDGTRYDGWQKQGNTGNTIQGKLEQVLGRMTGTSVELHGSGRTDAGVHALGQVANAHLETEMSTKEILVYMNRYLPEDIRVLEVWEAQPRFHSRLNAAGKIYVYQLDMAGQASVFERNYVYALGQRLDVNAMRIAADSLCGTHDYKSFSTGKTGKKSTVRTIWRITIRQEGTRLWIEYYGNGFLYNMVRILTGTLIEVGQGKRTPESIAGILEARDRETAGFTAPAKGLFLKAVLYS